MRHSFAAPKQCFRAREQFTEIERFTQVVIGARIQQVDFGACFASASCENPEPEFRL